MLTTNRATERLTHRLERAGLKMAIVKASADRCGKYLLLRDGRAIGSAGWTLSEAASLVSEVIRDADDYR